VIGERWIVDTNVIVAGLITADGDSPPACILDAMLKGELRFILCVELLGEYRSVLPRPRIRTRHGLNAAEIDEILHALATTAIVVDISDRDEVARDPGDNHLWRLLAACPDAGLITGDALLIASPPPGRNIVAPREFAARL
jgi:putative PIN family toxin of toxin-antitoxin system